MEIGMLHPDRRKPSVQVQQVKWDTQALTEQRSVTCDRTTRRTGKISSLGQHLLTAIWTTGDLHAFIFPLETAAPYKESVQQRNQNRDSAAVSLAAQAPAASSLLAAGQEV